MNRRRRGLRRSRPLDKCKRSPFDGAPVSGAGTSTDADAPANKDDDDGPVAADEDDDDANDDDCAAAPAVAGRRCRQFLLRDAFKSSRVPCCSGVDVCGVDDKAAGDIVVGIVCGVVVAAVVWYG